MKRQQAEREGQAGRRKGHKFVEDLLWWHQHENNREMAWKGEKDPYKIWLSEVMLQQTRVEQGTKYYQKFLDAFPTIYDLAKAPEERVFKLWEGLGYYSRCRNLLHTAHYIAHDLGGVFPSSYADILSLKGVGSYTAAAIASFAYNQPYAVLDGNVFRVLSRVFAVDTPIDTTAGKKTFAALAQEILPVAQAGVYNQAIMDFGASVCKPVPVCSQCFYQHQCPAYQQGRQDLLPVKAKKAELRKRWLNYFVVQCGQTVLVQQRTHKDVWQGLYHFLLIETQASCRRIQLEALLQQQMGIKEFAVIDEWKAKQNLSHQAINFHVLHLKLPRRKHVDGYEWVPFGKLRDLAFPRTLQAVTQRFAP